MSWALRRMCGDACLRNVFLCVNDTMTICEFPKSSHPTLLFKTIYGVQYLPQYVIQFYTK